MSIKSEWNRFWTAVKNKEMRLFNNAKEEELWIGPKYEDFMRTSPRMLNGRMFMDVFCVKGISAYDIFKDPFYRLWGLVFAGDYRFRKKNAVLQEYLQDIYYGEVDGKMGWEEWRNEIQ